MNPLLEQLGIDWKLFLSQMVNFFILLLVLRAFVYKPLLIAIRERNKKIKEGLSKAAEADIRLKEVDAIAKEKIKEADFEAVAIIKSTEQKAKELASTLQEQAEQKQQELLRQAQASYEKAQEESKRKVLEQAGELVRKFIVKTVGLKPEAIDEALVNKAIESMDHEK